MVSVPHASQIPSPGAPARRSRAIRIAVAILIPGVLTAMAAVLGYAFAVYPIWHHVDQVRRTETLGGFIPVDKLRQSAIAAYQPDSGITVQAFDTVAWAVRTTMTPFVGYGAAPGESHNAFINSEQLRGRRPLVMPKPPGVTRVILVGASVAFSAGAPSDDRTIGAYLQRLLDTRASDDSHRYEVFTFATPAWSSTHERIAIENRVSEWQPDLVVSLTGVADAVYGEHGHNVLWARALTDQYYWDIVNIALQRSGFSPMVDVQDASSTPVAPELVAERLRKNVLLAGYALSMSGARYHVFLQPGITTTGKRLSPRERQMRFTKSGYFRDAHYFETVYARIDERLRGEALPPNTAYTNLRAVFDALDDHVDVFVDAFHFGDRGNEIIARAIIDGVAADLPPTSAIAENQ